MLRVPEPAHVESPRLEHRRCGRLELPGERAVPGHLHADAPRVGREAKRLLAAGIWRGVLVLNAYGANGK